MNISLTIVGDLKTIKFNEHLYQRNGSKGVFAVNNLTKGRNNMYHSF